MSDITMGQIKSKIEGFGSDNLSVCGGTYVGGIYSQQISDEITPVIYSILEGPAGIFECKTMLEIGSASGAVPYIFSRFFDIEHVTIIDDNNHKNHAHRGRILKDVNYVEFIGDSHSKEALKFVDNLDMNYDIIFIDGDHSYAGVKKDMEMYFQFSEYLGYIILHDTIACPGVKQFFNELIKGYEYDIQFIQEYKSKEHTKPLGIGLFRSNNYRPLRRNPL